MRYILGILSLWCLVCIASDFVIKDPPQQSSPSKLKEEVLTLMGDLLELETQVLEVSAKVQQKLCKDIRASLEGVSSSRVRLNKLKALLQQENTRLNEHKTSQQRFLSALQ